MPVMWPSAEQILEYLEKARYVYETDGWRTAAEIAGYFECPDFARVCGPAWDLRGKGVETRSVEDGPTLYRATQKR